MASLAETFIAALGQLEDKGELEPIVRLFASNAEVSNPLVQHYGGEQQAARDFWRSYRESFEAIQSEFRNVVEQDRISVLEWISTGATASGHFRYGGVSVLEHDGQHITAFRSYFDPSKLTARASEAHGDAAASPLEAAQESAAEQRQEGGYQ